MKRKDVHQGGTEVVMWRQLKSGQGGSVLPTEVNLALVAMIVSGSATMLGMGKCAAIGKRKATCSEWEVTLVHVSGYET